MLPLMARGLAIIGGVVSLAEASHVTQQGDGDPGMEEHQLAYELTGKPLNRTGPFKAFPQISLRNTRPVVVFKMDRTGSSWFAHQLQEIGIWKKVKPEATNNHEWCRHNDNPKLEKCTTLVHDAMKYLSPKHGGVTLNPFKFACTNPNSEHGCYNMLMENLQQMQPFTIALVRKNIVLQAASHLRARAVEELGLCKHGFHVDRCDEAAQNYKAHVEPATLLDVARKNQEDSKQLSEMADKLAPANIGALHLTTEEFFDSESQSFVLPAIVWRYFGIDPSSPLWKDATSDDEDTNESSDDDEDENLASRFVSHEKTATESRHEPKATASPLSNETETDQEQPVTENAAALTTMPEGNEAEEGTMDDEQPSIDSLFEDDDMDDDMNRSVFEEIERLAQSEISSDGHIAELSNESLRGLEDIIVDDSLGPDDAANAFEVDALYTNLIALELMSRSVGNELLRNYISNFEEVRAHFQEHAPELLPMVDASDSDS